MLTFITFLRSPFAKWLGIVLAIAGLCIGGYLFIYNRGVADCERKHQIALAEHIERAAAQAHQIAMQDAEIISWADGKKTVFKTLWKEHETIVYSDCSLSPAGRVLHNKATRYATDITDSSIESEPDSPTTVTGNGDTSRDGSSALAEHGTDAPVGN
jgi:hypothetical protein